MGSKGLNVYKGDNFGAAGNASPNMYYLGYIHGKIPWYLTCVIDAFTPYTCSPKRKMWSPKVHL